MAQAKESALNTALKNAVEDAVKNEPFAVDIEKNRTILTDKIYSKASNYIVSYRIILEEQLDEIAEETQGLLPFYRISIEVGISKDALFNDLVSSGIIKISSDIGRIITLTISDIYEYKDFIKIKDGLKGMKGIKGIFYRQFSRGKFTMGIETNVSPAVIAEELVSKDIGDFKIEIIYTSDTLLYIKIIKRK